MTSFLSDSSLIFHFGDPHLRRRVTGALGRRGPDSLGQQALGPAANALQQG
jgi:hypothetical protein